MPATEKVFSECLNCGRHFSSRKEPGASALYCCKPCMIEYEAKNGRAGRVKSERLEFTCKVCGKPFYWLPGFINTYRKKHGRDPLYCSRTCTGLARRANTEKEQVFQCENCGKTVPRRRHQRSTGYTKFYTEQKFCSPECKHEGIAKRAENRFLAGRMESHVKRGNYVWLSIPANLNGGKRGAMMEHRWVMQQHIGRKLLREETVHHVNGDRGDNRLENLELFSSRHGPGQRVIDKINFAVEMILLYPEFVSDENWGKMLAMQDKAEH